MAKFRTREQEVEVVRVKRDDPPQEGKKQVPADGDFIVWDQAGKRILDELTFLDMYSPVDDEARKLYADAMRRLWGEDEAAIHRWTFEELRLRDLIGKYAENHDFEVNPDKNVVYGVIRGLARQLLKYGQPHCPCALVTGNKELDKDTICPCKAHLTEIEDKGQCHCGLFVKGKETPKLS